MGSGDTGRRVDLARLAAAYGHRSESGVFGRALAAADAARLGSGKLAIDVGGGTGSHAAVFAATGARSLVVDRSREMAVAARRTGVAAVVADGGRLPLRDGIADLVYFHLSIHHGDPGAWLGEGVRVTAPGGTVWVWTLAAEHHRTSFLSRWFPSVAGLDEGRFPDAASLAGLMSRLGLVAIQHGGAVEQVSHTAGSWAAAVRSGFVSTLHLLDQEEVHRGLEAFASAHPDPDEPIEYTLALSRVSAERPSLPS